MKNKKISRIVTILIISVILLVGIIIFILNFTSDDSSYSIIEKKWITDNKNNIIDVSVYNDIPVYGNNGFGVIFDFLDSFSKEYNINFNKISYYIDSDTDYSNLSFRALNNSEQVGDKDILMYEDNYAILKRDDTDLFDLSSIKKIGINKSDKSDIEYYFGDDIEYVEYESDDSLIDAIVNEEVDYIATASLMHMDDILKNNLNVVYNITDISKKYIIRVEDETLYNIIKKFYQQYLLKEYQDSYSENYLATYFDNKNIDSNLRTKYNSKIYKYGYVVNMPYENYNGSSFVGTISNYLSEFENVFNIEIDAIMYDNVDDLKNALVSNEIDFALTNFNYSNLNIDGVVTGVVDDYKYVVLSKSDIVADSIRSFKNYTLEVVGSSYLYNICEDNNIKTSIFNNTDDLIRNISDSSIAVMDYDTYTYYKNTKLSDFKIIYYDNILDGYRFIINKNDEVLAGLINYYVSNTNYDSVRYKYNTDIMLDNDYTNIKITVIILVIVLGLFVSIYLIFKNDRNKIMSKEDKLKFIDPMTSLKNRNYLNYNISKWDDNVIFPQCIIMLDLNKLREINDKEGREIGDDVIRKTASVLINSQKENTDILRSGGDEFLIYMVGYGEEQVKEYIRFLFKELKKIPHSFGVEIGYSMINDEVKIVDDAINEALIMMMKSKDKK